MRIRFSLLVTSMLPALAFLLATKCTAQISPSQLFENRESNSSGGTTLGTSVVFIGDIDKDGFDDYASSAHKPLWGKSLPHVSAFSGRTGTRLWKRVDGKAADRYGASLTRIHDFDKDGFRDLLLGAPLFDVPGAVDAGMVQILSSKTGKVLKTLYGVKAKDQFGKTTAALGDVNKDGTKDFAIAAPLSPGGTGWGTVYVYSGKPKAPLLNTYTGLATGDYFGTSIADAGDVDKDGYADILISAPGAKSTTPGYVRLFSSRFRLLKYHLKASAFFSSMRNFGMHLTPIGDITRDGLPEVICSTGHNGIALFMAAFTIKTGKVVYYHGVQAGPKYSKYAGIPKVALIGDLDKDGYPEYVVGDAITGISVYSSFTQKRIYSETRSSPYNNIPFGDSVAGGGDINGDGVPDFLVGAPWAVGNLPVKTYSSVHVFSGKHLTLTATAHEISIKNGGTSTYHVDAGKQHAGLYYLMVGTLSGTRPGMKVGGYHLPLNPLMGAAMDPWLSYTLGNLNGPLLGSSFGQLDSNGKASVLFKILPALAPRKFAGFTFNHAYMVLDLKTMSFKMASNARPVTLITP